VAFTELDVQALRDSAELIGTGVVDTDTWLVMARTIGQSLARLAEAQIEVFRRSAGLALTDDEDALRVAVEAGAVAVPRIEALLLFVWRRQLAAAVERALTAERDPNELPNLAVGFLDLVDYTRSTRHWDAAQLERTLETFERDVSLRVANVGGRVIKTLGDGVLYVTPGTRSAVEVALETLAAHAADAELPSVRAGVATGAVLERLGDVYGEPVNLASRLSDEARPGSLLVDRQAAGDLEAADDLQVRPLERRSVRGYRSLSPFLVRRAA
jgi:adenylate cyclase